MKYDEFGRPIEPVHINFTKMRNDHTKSVAPALMEHSARQWLNCQHTQDLFYSMKCFDVTSVSVSEQECVLTFKDGTTHTINQTLSP